MEKSDHLELLSITAAARKLAVGKDTLYNLITAGRIGYIEIGKRKKITHAELIRFQNESITKHTHLSAKEPITAKDIDKIFQLNQRSNTKTLNGKEFLSTIMRKNNGNNH